MLAAMAAAVVLAVGAARLLARRNARRLGSLPLWTTLGERPSRGPAVIAFSTPECGVCRTAQAPALQALHSRTGARVVRVDAAARPEVARAFGVLTVPTTIVLGDDGRVRAVNNGFASADRLAAQLSARVAD